MSATAIVTAIKAIAAILKVVQSVQSLNAGGAINRLSVNDLVHVIQTANHSFFTTIVLADITEADDHFRRVWLPTVLREDSIRPITAQDVQSGRLSATFMGIANSMQRLYTQLNRLEGSFRANESRLHVDELVRGCLAFVNALGLLLHMHAVYTELQRIRLGASSLEASDLINETHQALLYLGNGQSWLSWFEGRIWSRREDLVGQLRSRTTGNVAVITTWSFNDNYRPNPSTPAHLRLSYGSFDNSSRNRQTAQNLRNQHIQRLLAHTKNIVLGASSEARAEFAETERVLEGRFSRQSVSRAILEGHALVLGQPGLGVGGYPTSGITGYPVTESFTTPGVGGTGA